MMDRKTLMAGAITLLGSIGLSWILAWLIFMISFFLEEGFVGNTSFESKYGLMRLAANEGHNTFSWTLTLLYYLSAILPAFLFIPLGFKKANPQDLTPLALFAALTFLIIGGIQNGIVIEAGLFKWHWFAKVTLLAMTFWFWKNYTPSPLSESPSTA